GYHPRPPRARKSRPRARPSPNPTPAPLPTMTRTGRLRRDEFDIALRAPPHPAAAVVLAASEDRVQLLGPGVFFQRQIDETGARHIDPVEQRIVSQLLGKRFGKLARLSDGSLG